MATKVILLDTDALIEYIRGNEDMQKVFDSITDKYVYINPIIKAEVQSACVGKAELNKINNFLDSIPIFNLDIETSEIFSQLFEKSQLFYSKSDNLITANNLSASNNKNAVEPKEKATIDKIFKQMQ